VHLGALPGKRPGVPFEQLGGAAVGQPGPTAIPGTLSAPLARGRRGGADGPERAGQALDLIEDEQELATGLTRTITFLTGTRHAGPLADYSTPARQSPRSLLYISGVNGVIALIQLAKR
jgi:hypothetical protein